jgi:hypothetical protein
MRDGEGKVPTDDNMFYNTYQLRLYLPSGFSARIVGYYVLCAPVPVQACRPVGFMHASRQQEGHIY